jgi:hypothetical protein
MKRTHIIAALTAALVAVIGTIFTGCASMQLVSVETDTVDGPKQVRQGYDIIPREITVWGIFKDGSRKTVNISNTNITFDKNTPGTQTVKVRVSGQEATFQTQVMPLRTLTVSSPPKTALFKVGQEPDATWPGLEIRGEWDQMGGEKIPLASCEITGYRKEQAGKQTIRVAYLGLTAAFDVDVRAMTSIVIAQAPTKIDYVQGETLNLAGLRVTGVWEGFPAETLAVTASDVTGFNTNNVGIQHVTVTKNGKSAIFDVEVMALTSIEVDKPPTKTDYKMGEALDLTGIMVYGNYTGANPNKKKRELIPVSQLTTSGYEPNRIGKQQRVTVTVRGQNANFFVNIDLAPVVTPQQQTYKLGDTGPGGGKIFYYSTTGFTMTDTNQTCYYLEAAPADMSTDLRWAWAGFVATGIDTAEAIGTGRKNTALILAPANANAPAAKACKDFNGGGRTDWFMPSKDELNQLYLNRSAVGNIGTNLYWSSSQDSNTSSWWQNFYNGNQGKVNKDNSLSIRAIRAF